MIHPRVRLDNTRVKVFLLTNATALYTDIRIQRELNMFESTNDLWVEKTSASGEKNLSENLFLLKKMFQEEKKGSHTILVIFFSL